MTFPLWLTLAFIVLKLIHAIEWEWWWVLSPALLVFVLSWLKQLKSELAQKEKEREDNNKS